MPEPHNHRLVRHAERLPLANQSVQRGFDFTIGDSNLSDFSDAAVFVHPESPIPVYRDFTAERATAFPTRGGLVGEPVDLYMYNDTISNSAKGSHINATQGDDTSGNTPYGAVAAQRYVLQRRSPSSRTSRSSTERMASPSSTRCQ